MLFLMSSLSCLFDTKSFSLGVDMEMVVGEIGFLCNFKTSTRVDGHEMVTFPTSLLLLGYILLAIPN